MEYKKHVWEMWKEGGYMNGFSKEFQNIDELIIFMKKRFDNKIDYDKLISKFEYTPKKLYIVASEDGPKDIFYYSSTIKPLRKRHIDLRKGIEKNK